MLLDTEQTQLPSRSLLSPRWMGPFKVLPCTAHNTYRLELPENWRAFDKFKVERLLPYRCRPTEGRRASTRRGDCRRAPAHGTGAAQAGSRCDLLVRWAGRDASGDTWEPLDSSTDCLEAISAFERATGYSGQRRRRRATPARDAAAGCRRRAADAGCRPFRRHGLRASRQSGRRARGSDAALLVAGRRVAALHCGTPLPARALFRMSCCIRGRRRRCAARRTRCRTRHPSPAAISGCFCPRMLATVGVDSEGRVTIARPQGRRCVSIMAN